MSNDLTGSSSPHGRPARPVDAGRERILAAARDLLHLDDVSAFSLDAVARRAGVTRMTVYNQFGSKAGLLEELFDLLMERGAFREMPTIFTQPDAGSAFDVFVAIIGRFYTENRPVLVRLSAAAGTDPDLDAAMATRNERRRWAIETLIKRIGKDQRPAVSARELVNTLDVMLNFNTFNAIAGPDRTPTDIVPVMRDVIRNLLGGARPERRPRGKPVRKKRPSK